MNPYILEINKGPDMVPKDFKDNQIKYKGEKYYIIVGEEPQVVYEILDDDDVGNRVGIRKKKGKGYVVNFD